MHPWFKMAAPRLCFLLTKILTASLPSLFSTRQLFSGDVTFSFVTQPFNFDNWVHEIVQLNCNNLLMISLSIYAKNVEIKFAEPESKTVINISIQYARIKGTHSVPRD